MSSDPFLGEIILFGGNFAPRGWALCDGQLLSISSYSALFSILGTTYGGDGRSTFGLPDLRGRAPVHVGTGPGLSSYALGQRGGVETVTLNQAQIPAHSHAVNATDKGSSDKPTGLVPAAANSGASFGQPGGKEAAQMSSEMVAKSGGGQAHENRAPYLAVTYIIALQGTYPSRS